MEGLVIGLARHVGSNPAANVKIHECRWVPAGGNIGYLATEAEVGIHLCWCFKHLT